MTTSQDTCRPGSHRASRPCAPLTRRRRWVQPVALAIAADESDFARLRRAGLFGGTSYRGYLRRTQGQLRALRRRGMEVHLRILEPRDYADFCAAHGLEPQDAAARVAYAADPDLAGPPFVYQGEALGRLVPELVSDHLARARITLGAGALLDAVGSCEALEARLPGLLREADSLWLRLASGAGDGRHLVSVTTRAASGAERLHATAELCVERGRAKPAGRSGEAFRVILAAARAEGAGGTLLLLGRAAVTAVHGWRLVGGVPRPMHPAEVHRAVSGDPQIAQRARAVGAVRCLAGFDLAGEEPPGSDTG